MTPTQASILLPWRVTDISYRPFDGYWSFNPSIHFDGQTWRCVLRCADYALPDSVQIRGPYATPNRARTLNAMLILDPETWRPLEILPMQELDDTPRRDSASLGFEDIRLFSTRYGTFYGIAASRHLAQDETHSPNWVPPVEQVLLSFDDRCNIVQAMPLRGPSWRSKHQKNWSPFEGADLPRFLSSIERGRVVHVDEDGEVKMVLGRSEQALAKVPSKPAWPPGRRQAPVAGPEVRVSAIANKGIAQGAGPEVRMSRGGGYQTTVSNERLTKSSNTAAYHGLRGGTQLQKIGDGHWLGVAHDMIYSDAKSKKFYWHVFYLVNDDGELLAKSQPVKLAPEYGIEFAAGLAIDGDRAVISYGTDDMHGFIAETSLSAIVELLVPIDAHPAVEAPATMAAVAAGQMVTGSAVIDPRPFFVGADIVAAAATPGASLLDDAALEVMDAPALRRAYRALRDRPGKAMP